MIKRTPEERIALAKIKSSERLQKLRLKKLTSSRGRIRKEITAPISMPTLTREQGFLSEMFGGSEPTWGTGQNLPKFEGALRTGYGLINNEDEGETGAMFGII